MCRSSETLGSVPSSLLRLKTCLTRKKVQPSAAALSRLMPSNSFGTAAELQGHVLLFGDARVRT